MSELSKIKTYGEKLEQLKTIEYNQVNHKLLVFLLMDTGARVSEALTFKWENIDWKNNKIWNRVLKKRKLTYGWFYFSPVTHDLLMKNARKKGLIIGISKRYAYDLVQYYGKKIGIEGLHPHVLRHNFAINWVTKGKNIETLRRLLHHTRLDNTQIYLDFGDEYIKKEYDI